MTLEVYISELSQSCDPEDTDIQIENFKRNGSNGQLILNITRDFYDEKITQEAVIQISQCKQFSLNANSISEVKLLDDHPLLWQFNDHTASLYFNSGTGDGNRLFFDIQRVHNRLMAPYLPVETFLNHERRAGIVFAQFGIFAKGPLKLMQAFAECLHAAGMKHNISMVYPPGTLKRMNIDAEQNNPKMLVLESSYIIAEAFTLHSIRDLAS